MMLKSDGYSDDWLGIFTIIQRPGHPGSGRMHRLLPGSAENAAAPGPSLPGATAKGLGTWPGAAGSPQWMT